MGQAAYELERFAPRPRSASAAPRIRVAKKQKSQRRAQVMRMVRTLAVVVVLVVLVCGVLYTQAEQAALHSRITSQEKALAEEQSLYTYLNFQLENMSSLKSIEEAAAARGFEKITGGQVTYYRVDEGARIEVKEDALSALFADAQEGLLSMWEYFSMK